MKFPFLSLVGMFFLSACVETTTTQRGYADARDDCRAYSEARISLPSEKEKDEKSRLLSLFAECMNKKGWAVGAPGDKPKEEKPKTAAAPVIVEKPSVISYYVPPMPMAQSANFGMDRAASCAYARHAKQHSALAKEVAQDCDRECKSASTPDWQNACAAVEKKR
jgi:hypothetical protein